VVEPLLNPTHGLAKERLKALAEVKNGSAYNSILRSGM